MPNLQFTTTTTLESLVDDVCLDSSDETLVEFVKAIDEKIETWEFTLALYEHFAAMKKIYDEEQKLYGEG